MSELPHRETRSWRRSTWLILYFLFVGLIGLGFWALAASWESFGFALVIGVPLAIGGLCGYASKEAAGFALLLMVFLSAGLVASAVILHISGLLCALVLLALSLVPMLVGLVAGRLLRRSTAGHRLAGVAVPLLLVVLPLPGLWWEGHLGPPPYTVEVVRTSRIVDLPPDRAWQRIVFYEDVPTRPPMLARIGLPRPLHTEGIAQGVGALIRCVYSTGYLVKRITEHEPPRRLTFEVLEQHQVEDRSVELIDGGFELEPVAGGRTRITLETRYRPLLQARIFWRPFERSLARVLHHHVLDGIALGVDAGADPDARSPSRQPAP